MHSMVHRSAHSARHVDFQLWFEILAGLPGLQCSHRFLGIMTGLVFGTARHWGLEKVLRIVKIEDLW